MSYNSEAKQLVVDEAAAVGILQHLDKNELQNLLEDTDKLDSLIQDLQQVKSIQTDREMMLARNKSMAEFNLSFQNRLENMKGEVAKHYEDANKLKIDLAQDKSKIDSHPNRLLPDTALALLQTASASSEESSEQFAEQFCDNKISVDSFLENYLPVRTVAHLRQVKVKKMRELMNSGLSRTGAPNQPSTNSYSCPSGLGNLPYPTGNMAMPLPSMYPR
uniref:Vacuolar protein sorting-associated protein 37B-like n=1 Tax=Crassostrea virginica TaxID=6565 RepID=A0A8B8EBA0_CRAVI|nr:vacuolar protein sorting-associated protein 37B-like [Crassostrea virginica]XP_022337396.1 vacuolar protein sorting-associated protein 37B-like [Crassostrea virginica]